ncbi:MAG: hypothetical protein U0638_13425 [Phycisphaerales bacterium]
MLLTLGFIASCLGVSSGIDPGSSANFIEVNLGYKAIWLLNGRILFAEWSPEAWELRALGAPLVWSKAGWWLPYYAHGIPIVRTWGNPLIPPQNDPPSGHILIIPVLPPALLVLASGGIFYFKSSRARSGFCLCGYSLAGLAPIDGVVTCPECGATHKPPPCAFATDQLGTATHHA